jgi:Zn-dependent protease with chaperone function
MRLAGSLPRSTAVRIGGAAVAMVVAAEVAVWLLSPSDEPPEPVPVAESDYFSPAELGRAEDYRSGQRWLLVASLVVEGAVLVAIALGRPAPVRRALDRLGRRPVLGAAVAGAGVSLLTTLATLPVSIISHERSVDVGLSTQSLGSWFWDVARSAGITALLTEGGAALLMALVRRFPRGWPIPAAVAVSGLAVVFVWIAPVVLAPIFSKFEPLPESSKARADVLELGREAGVDIGQVYRIDASRRSTALNAYVDGIGSTKRVVLYDNLLQRAARPQLRSIVAHELGHVAHDDVPRGILYVVLVTPLGLVFAREVALAIARRSGADPASPAAIPAYLLALALTGFILNVPGNQLSREVEASADEFALELTHDPDALIKVQRQLARTNLSDPDPPGVYSWLFGTHPSTVDRIGAALTYEREHPG